MGLLDLISSLGAGPGGVWSEFVDAHAGVAKMRRVVENLATITRCLSAENPRTRARCAAYIHSHGLEKTILRLSPKYDIEDLLIALFAADHACPAAVWEYGPFPRLSRTMCELCVSHETFDASLADHLIGEISSGSTEILSGLALLCPVPSYAQFFAETGLGPRVLETANRLIAEQSSAAPAVINFLCLYDDVCGHRHAPTISSPTDNFRFLRKLFAGVPYPRIRVAIIAAASEASPLPEFPAFLLCCLEIDPVLVAGMLSEEHPRVRWSPAAVHSLFEMPGDSSDAGMVARLAATVTRDPSHVAYRIYRFPLLDILIGSRVGDTEPYLFLALTDRRTFFSRIHEIVDVCRDSRRLLGVVSSSLLHRKCPVNEHQLNLSH